jgi:hypothetical protein
MKTLAPLLPRGVDLSIASQGEFLAVRRIRRAIRGDLGLVAVA